jgi:N-acetylglucosamine-6-phosphate deacetylase
VIARAIAAVETAMAMHMPGIIGIHIEGPFLNADKRGIHDASKFRTLNDAAIDLLSSLKQGKTLVTLAPERAPPGMIRALVDRGVIVAAGHSMASHDDMTKAAAEGLSGVTHLFNAMTPLQSRDPGMVGAVLASHLYAGLIADGHHVHPAAMQAAFRAKGAGEIMLVTDAMPVVGSGSDHFLLGGQEIKTDQGRLISADGTLAGSNLDMASAVRNAISMMGVSLEEALTMASTTPAEFLGLGKEFGQIAPGYHADIIHLDAAMMVQRSWISGVMSPE